MGEWASVGRNSSGIGAGERGSATPLTAATRASTVNIRITAGSSRSFKGANPGGDADATARVQHGDDRPPARLESPVPRAVRKSFVAPTHFSPHYSPPHSPKITLDPR